ncbi:Crp/Fnr family transcriptional regulator [Shimia sp. R11_0]|uniref:Crp/Fnr family transcriptional regulator n=1 Tax=Shimia sp. R11_0 TaxID=2821096 RepID=UPI001ADCBD89|nr:Crp/Fnr family transcriptional regulator [Shimia sp. R11_0]MBO9479581.1 Crp/Fnr family transcriptional regulator [Shimia sp. R11_0]
MTGLFDHGSLRFLDMLKPEIQAEIASVERRRAYDDGHMIHSRGDDGNRLMIVRSGAVRVGRVNSNGRETILAVLGPGHFMGIMGVLTGRARNQNAVAVGETTIGYVQKADFMALMEKYPEIASAALPITLNRLNVALNMLDDLRLLPLPAYTAVMLLNMHDASEVRGVVHWSQSEIAVAVGASRVSVGKALKKLEGEGLIALKYGAIEIPDVDALSEWIDAARADHLSY